MVERGGDRGERLVNIRPWLLGLRMLDSGENWVEFHLEVKTGSQGGARPQEILHALGLLGRGVRLSCRRTALGAQPREGGAQTPRAGRGWGARRRFSPGPSEGKR